MSHVVVGGGHFVERAGQLVQTAQTLQQSFPRMLEAGRRERAIRDIARESMDMETYRHMNRDMQRLRMQIGNSESESTAWRDFAESHEFKAAKEALLSAGCAAAGDYQGAAEHAVESVVETAQAVVDTIQGLWDKLSGTTESQERGLWQRAGDGR